MSARPECSVDGCERPAYARGWCSRHYQRWRNNGDPLLVKRGWHFLDWGRIQREWNYGFGAGDIARHLDASVDSVRHAILTMRRRGFELYAERDPRRCGGGGEEADQ